MKGFAASPMGTATPHENQKIETTHVGASKQAFCAKLPQISRVCSYNRSNIDVFLRVFLMNLKTSYT